MGFVVRSVVGTSYVLALWFPAPKRKKNSVARQFHEEPDCSAPHSSLRDTTVTMALGQALQSLRQESYTHSHGYSKSSGYCKCHAPCTSPHILYSRSGTLSILKNSDVLINVSNIIRLVNHRPMRYHGQRKIRSGSMLECALGR